MNKYRHFIFAAVLCLAVTVLICPAAVSAKNAPKNFQVSHKKLTLFVGEFEFLHITSVNPENASDKVIWKSKDKKVASVTAKGEVVAKKAGKTEIIAVSKQNAKVCKSIEVTVKQKPKQIEKDLTVKGGIYALDTGGDSFSTALKKSVPELSRTDRNYKIIRTRQDYKRLVSDLKKNGCTNPKKTILASYANTKFKNSCLLLMNCPLSYPDNQKVIGFSTEFDASGKLCGKISVQYRDVRESGISYPAVMQDNVTILKLDKKDAGMIDYFKYNIMPYQE